MTTTSDLCLALVLGFLVTIPITRVTAQCDPISSVQITQVACTAAGCTPTPAGTAAVVPPIASIVVTSSFMSTGTCTIADDLSVTFTDPNTIACFATVTSCNGGTVVAVVDSESADSSIETDDSASDSSEGDD